MNDKGKIVRSFILGFILGGALIYTGIHFCRHYRKGHTLWGRHHRFDSQKILEKLSKELDLTADQKIQVEKILESKLPKFKELRESVRPKFDALRESIQIEIRTLLNSEQQVKFNKLIEDFEKRRKKREERRDRGR